mgnify:CR=1 FL=1
MTNSVDNIGNKISMIRKNKNISQRELAQKANLSQSFISHLEHGKRNPTLNTLQSIAHALDIPLNKFLLFIIDEIKDIS